MGERDGMKGKGEDDQPQEIRPTGETSTPFWASDEAAGTGTPSADKIAAEGDASSGSQKAEGKQPGGSELLAGKDTTTPEALGEDPVTAQIRQQGEAAGVSPAGQDLMVGRFREAQITAQVEQGFADAGLTDGTEAKQKAGEAFRRAAESLFTLMNPGFPRPEFPPNHAD